MRREGREKTCPLEIKGEVSMTKRNRRGARWMERTALGVIAATIAAPALAQSAMKVETVVVTAERRATNLQTTGIAATVFTGEDLTKKNINSLDNLAFTTPDLTIQDAGGTVLLNIRGIGKSDGGQEVPPGTLIYRNGVPVTPGGILGDEPYYDIESVEVLRGPQGTFAGENATGGAIFITEARPSLDSFGGWAEGQYGSYDDMRVRGAVNIPVSDTFAIRIATNDENRDSFYNMSGPWTGNAGKLHESDWRLGMLWQPNDAFHAILTTDYNYIDFGGMPGSPYTGSTKNIFDVESDAHLQGIETQIRSVLEMSYRFDDGITLRSVGGYQIGHIAVGKDVDGTAGPIGIIQDQHSDDTTWSEELNLLSPDTGRFTWVLGASFVADQVHGPDNLPQVLEYTPVALLNDGFTLLHYTADKKDFGIFGQGTYNITNSLKLQVGARYSEDSFTLNSLTKYLLGFYPSPPFPPGVPVDLWQLVSGEKEKDSRLTGKINLEWSVDDNDFLYAFVATGHKGGGINGIGVAIYGGTTYPPTACSGATCPPIFKPEEVTDYEIGWKGTYFNDQLHTQLDGFYNDYRNFQVAVYDPTTAIGQVENAHGDSTIDGIEAQAQGQFGDFSFDFGLSYLHSAIGTFYASQTAAVCNPATGPAGGTCVNLTGRQQPNAAPWTAQAGIQYDFHLDGGQTLSPRIDYGGMGPRWATVFEVEPTDRIAAQNLFNAQLIYARPDDWQVTAYATNLFDLHYVASVDGSLAIPGPPRQVGIRISKSF
jgi:iron complex outermembrane recepter protein